MAAALPLAERLRRRRASRARWERDNAASARARQKRWRAKNVERMREHRREWKRRNPAKVRASNRRHMVRYHARTKDWRGRVAEQRANRRALKACYVAGLLRKGCPGLELPKVLVETKREYIKLRRAICQRL